MTNQLALSPTLSLPLEFATRAIAIFGIRGAGKTNTASVLVEELLDRNLPTVIIDPTDAWWGIRSEFPVFIFGGSHGDVPLQETDGKVVAQFIVAEKVPVVLSLRHLRKGAQRRFVTEFCEELYHLKGQMENRTSLMVVIDECPLFVPQKVLGETARVVGAIEDLITRGRNAGFGVTLISQRPATVNKDVLTQVDVIITHRITSPQDRKALGDWFDDKVSLDPAQSTASVLDTLSTMKEGMSWVWAPTLDILSKVQIRKRRTFDSSATPKIGEVVTAPKNLRDVDLEVLKGKMGAALQAAKDNDPAALKARIRQLEGEVSRMAAGPDQGVPPPVIQPLSKSSMDVIANTAQSIDAFRQQTEYLFAKAEELRKAFSNIGAEVSKLEHRFPAMRQDPRARPILRNHAPQAATFRAAARQNGDRQDISAVMARKMLIALAQHRGGLAKSQILLHTGYSASGSTSAAFTWLTQNGLAEGPGNSLRITEAGLKTLGDYEPLPLGEALRFFLLHGDKLSTMEKAILERVAGFYPHTVTKGEVLKLTGYSASGSTSKAFTRLRTYGYVITQGPSTLRAAEQLFDK